MPQLTVRNLSDDVYTRLKDRARINHRSLEAEVRAILEAGVRPDRRASVERALAIRDSLVGRYTGDPVREIREDRER
ncbi:MAG: plasmid stabilization protein [Alphaproteobacteria bacterium]|nr:plasmid stabilization protein [Alphaproteobacteria bacterium]